MRAYRLIEITLDALIDKWNSGESRGYFQSDSLFNNTPNHTAIPHVLIERHMMNIYWTPKEDDVFYNVGTVLPKGGIAITLDTKCNMVTALTHNPHKDAPYDAAHHITVKVRFLKFRSIYRKFKKLRRLIYERAWNKHVSEYERQLCQTLQDIVDKQILG